MEGMAGAVRTGCCCCGERGAEASCCPTEFLLSLLVDIVLPIIPFWVPLSLLVDIVLAMSGMGMASLSDSGESPAAPAGAACADTRPAGTTCEAPRAPSWPLRTYFASLLLPTFSMKVTCDSSARTSRKPRARYASGWDGYWVFHTLRKFRSGISWLGESRKSWWRQYWRLSGSGCGMENCGPCEPWDWATGKRVWFMKASSLASSARRTCIRLPRPMRERPGMSMRNSRSFS